ncbi:MAG: superoxide dismutase family protein [Acidobacteria bacterium]|nr:superoxide dismutase family protein [Acidobacteriota bacterium]
MLKHLPHILAVVVAVLLGGVSVGDQPEQVKNAKASSHEFAVAVLSPTKDSKVSGTILLRQKEGYILVAGEVTGLTPGKHGFHIHEFGDLRDSQGKYAGGHFNPTGEPHGAPDAPKHHVGDLGNIVADEKGTASVEKQLKGVKLNDLFGRAVVVHGGEDDLTSQPAGDAGSRMAVGVIGVGFVLRKEPQAIPVQGNQ